MWSKFKAKWGNLQGRSLRDKLNSVRRGFSMEHCEPFPLGQLPDLVIINIAKHLPVDDARNLSLVNRRFQVKKLQISCSCGYYKSNQEKDAGFF